MSNMRVVLVFGGIDKLLKLDYYSVTLYEFCPCLLCQLAPNPRFSGHSYRGEG